MTFTAPAVSPAGEFRRINAFGHIDLRIPAADTGGVMSVWESIAEPEAGPPLHIHSREDEMFYVLAGSFRVWCGDESYVAEPGATCVLPRNVPHTYRNIGKTTGRLLVAAMPGGFEDFFLEIERGGVSDPAEIARVADRYGLVFVPPRAAAA